MTSSVPAGTIYSSKLAQGIGFVALEASACEDKIGELVVLARGLNTDDPDADWWASGEKLADAVESLDDPQASRIAEEYRALLPLRHAIIHGLWIEGRDSSVTMLRGKSTKKAARALGFDLRASWADESITEIAERWLRLHGIVDKAISHRMGLA